ncbi:MAG TPA: hypothetical protein VFD92_22475 [Candidatus Binatia bacterium]|nr:hypothetical protein [Candidatus Binatia bacterium]
MSAPDWSALFGLEKSPLEIVVRGSLTYLGLFAILRVVLRRHSGAVGFADLLVVVLIADAAQNAMAGEYRSISDGASARSRRRGSPARKRAMPAQPARRTRMRGHPTRARAQAGCAGDSCKRRDGGVETSPAHGDPSPVPGR